MWSGGVLMFWAGNWPASGPPRPSMVDLVLSRVRHPSFTPEAADELVRDLTRRQLRRLWTETTGLLAEPMSDELRFRHVVLREQVLSELERRDPGAMSVCARRDRSVLVRWRRAGRS